VEKVVTSKAGEMISTKIPYAMLRFSGKLIANVGTIKNPATDPTKILELLNPSASSSEGN
jgi:hypothetical protein